MNIDKVAEAICVADDYIWGLLTAEERAPYHHRAEAAVAAMELTQEWKAVHESGGGIIRCSYAGVRDDFDNFVERPPGVEDPGSGRLTHIAVRWVSPWQQDGDQ